MFSGVRGRQIAGRFIPVRTAPFSYNTTAAKDDWKKLGRHDGAVAAAAPAQARNPHRMGSLPARRHCQLEQSEGDFRRFASAIHQVACDV